MILKINGKKYHNFKKYIWKSTTILVREKSLINKSKECQVVNAKIKYVLNKIK